jgi:hypothetical protein
MRASNQRLRSGSFDPAFAVRQLRAEVVTQRECSQRGRFVPEWRCAAQKLQRRQRKAAEGK